MYDLTLSIGTTFRPACIGEALDEVQVSEILAQKKYIDAAKSFGVNVMMEGIGHISLDMIPEYCKRTSFSIFNNRIIHKYPALYNTTSIFCPIF